MVCGLGSGLIGNVKPDWRSLGSWLTRAGDKLEIEFTESHQVAKAGSGHVA
jgi:hypothetical protein